MIHALDGVVGAVDLFQLGQVGERGVEFGQFVEADVDDGQLGPVLREVPVVLHAPEQDVAEGRRRVPHDEALKAGSKQREPLDAVQVAMGNFDGSQRRENGQVEDHPPFQIYFGRVHP